MPVLTLIFSEGLVAQLSAFIAFVSKIYYAQSKDYPGIFSSQEDSYHL